MKGLLARCCMHLCTSATNPAVAEYLQALRKMPINYVLYEVKALGIEVKVKSKASLIAQIESNKDTME